MTTTTMTDEQKSTFLAIPETLAVKVNGGVVTAKLTPSKAGNPLYRASVVVGLTSEDAPKDILERASVVFGDRDIDQAGKGVYVSEPKRYSATKKDGSTHPKAGELIPNSGGNWTVSHSNAVDIAGMSFQLQVRITIVDKGDEKGPRVRINVDCFKRAVNQGVTIGTVEGVSF